MRRNVPSLLRKFGRWRPTARNVAAGQAGTGDPSALLALDVYKTQSQACEGESPSCEPVDIDPAIRPAPVSSADAAGAACAR
jgi:hypothetical protein